MGRLIDADDLIGVIQYNTNYKPNKSAIMADELIRYINSQPTAYDMDKVVEQLEEARDELLHSTDYNNDIINYCLDWFDMAIDIVKGAVKDE